MELTEALSTVQSVPAARRCSSNVADDDRTRATRCCISTYQRECQRLALSDLAC